MYATPSKHKKRNSIVIFFFFPIFFFLSVEKIWMHIYNLSTYSVLKLWFIEQSLLSEIFGQNLRQCTIFFFNLGKSPMKFAIRALYSFKPWKKWLLLWKGQSDFSQKLFWLTVKGKKTFCPEKLCNALNRLMMPSRLCILDLGSFHLHSR